MSRHLCDNCARTGCCKWYGKNSPEAGVLPVTICKYHEAKSTDGYIKIPHGVYLALININAAITINPREADASGRAYMTSAINNAAIIKQREIIQSIIPMMGS